METLTRHQPTEGSSQTRTADQVHGRGAGVESQKQWADLHRAPAADDGDCLHRAVAQLLQRMLSYVCSPQPLMPLYSASGGRCMAEVQATSRLIQ